MWDVLVYILLTILLAYILKNVFSETPNSIQFHSKFLIYYFVASVVAVFMVPVLLMYPKNVRNSLWGAQLIKHVTKLIGIEWHFKNGQVMANDQGAMIVSNHQSSLDILGMFNIWHVPAKVTAISRKELLYVFPFGLAAYLAGVVFIDRNNSKNANTTLDVTSKVMVNDKTKIWMFPEGTRNKDFTKLLPFKRGAFRIAVAAQVPIIPVVISPYYFINRKKYIFNIGHAIIQCLEPVSTEGLSPEDVPALTDRVYDLMQDAYKKLSDEVLSALPPDYPLASKC